MRILHTIPGRNWGGMEHRTIEQVKWLVAHGHDVWLAAPPDGEPFKRAQALGLPVVPLCFDPPLRAVPALRRFIREHRIEVMDAHVTRDAKAGLFCLDLCAQVRSRHVNQYLKPSLTRRLQWHLADHVITVAECTRQDLVRDGIIDAGRSRSIGGWADERFFDLPDPGTTRARLRAEIGIADGATTIVCVGMLRPDKGQNFLIEALAGLKARGLDLTLVLAGSATAEGAEYESGLRAQAAEAGVPTHFLGYREDVSELMQTADLVVIPSLTEAQPRVAVQAFATGRPVVASAVGGVPEIVLDGQTGWLVPPADVPALTAAIARVVQNPAEAAKVAEGARALAEQRMRFDHRMAETLETYRVAIARAKRRPFIRVR